MPDYQPDNCAALAHALIENAMVPPYLPVRMVKNKETGVVEQIVSKEKLTALANRADVLVHFSQGRMIGYMADSYELDSVRIRRRVRENAEAHRVTFKKYYKILKDYEQTQQKTESTPPGDIRTETGGVPASL